MQVLSLTSNGTSISMNIEAKSSKVSISELIIQLKQIPSISNATVSNISISDEYMKLYENFDFSIDDFKAMNKNAVEGAFLNEDDKRELLKKL